MPSQKLTLPLLILVVALTGCVAYQYKSWGEFGAGDDAPQSVVLYWKEDRTTHDSGVNLLRCGDLPYAFSPGPAGNMPLHLPPRPGDRVVTSLADLGATPVNDALAGQACAVVLANGKPAQSGAIDVGDEIAIAILCENPQRYPEPGIYSFSDLERRRHLLWFGLVTPDPPSPCAPPAG